MTRNAGRRAPSRSFARRVLVALAVTVLGLLSLNVAVAPAFASGDLKGTLVDQLGQPVLGLDFEVWSSSTGTVVSTVSSDSTTGEFDLNLPDGSYYYWVHDGAMDAGGDTYGLRSESFFITGADTVLGDLVIQKYVDVSGTISNWTAAMGDIHVQLKTNSGGGWFTVASADSTGASFTVPTTLVDGDYTLYFQLDLSSTAPYLDAFLGGEFLDPAAAATVTATAGTPLSGISMTMPDAAFITGTVTDSDTGVGLDNIYVSTDERPDYDFYADTYTDSNGDYSLRVIPGLTYAVYADDPAADYISMTYQNLDGCGCTFTPVTSTYADPATGIDFALIKDASAAYIEGVVLDDSLGASPGPDPFENVLVHLYKPVTGGWSQVDVVQSDSNGEFQLTLPTLGSYRLRFEYSGSWLPVIDGLVGQGSASGPDPAAAGCVVDTGSLDASSVNSHVAYYVIAGLNQAGGCAAEPTPSSGGSGTSSGGHGRSHPASTIDTTTVVTPTPTPTPTATPSPSPSASDDATPSPQPTSQASTSAGLDLTWLWIGIGCVLALIIGFVVTMFIRGRRA
ncbi:MAG TPA: hypothetical protein VGM94_11140 [Galbitalea sp.]|jgi:hypothetical protein